MMTQLKLAPNVPTQTVEDLSGVQAQEDKANTPDEYNRTLDEATDTGNPAVSSEPRCPDVLVPIQFAEG